MPLLKLVKISWNYTATLVTAQRISTIFISFIISSSSVVVHTRVHEYSQNPQHTVEQCLRGDPGFCCSATYTCTRRDRRIRPRQVVRALWAASAFNNNLCDRLVQCLSRDQLLMIGRRGDKRVESIIRLGILISKDISLYFSYVAQS